MTSTSCRSAALDRIIAPWAAKIAAFLAAIVETILAIAENSRNTLQGLGSCCWKAGRRRPALSRPMMSKLTFLPPWARVLHALACKRSPEFGPAVIMDLRGKSEARIKALFAELSASGPSRRRMTILIPPALDDDNGSDRRICPHVKKRVPVWPICESLSATEHWNWWVWQNEQP